jgi:hypothetical protein
MPLLLLALSSALARHKKTTQDLPKYTEMEAAKDAGAVK